MKIFLLILFGFLGGILGGMGMGGGTLLIPLLTIFLNIAQKEAQAINLLAFLPMSLIALIIHCKNKLIKYKYGIPIIITGIISSVISSFFVNKTSSENLRFLFGIFLIVMGIFQIFSLFIFKKKTKNNERYHDCSYYNDIK